MAGPGLLPITTPSSILKSRDRPRPSRLPVSTAGGDKQPLRLRFAPSIATESAIPSRLDEDDEHVRDTSLTNFGELSASTVTTESSACREERDEADDGVAEEEEEDEVVDETVFEMNDEQVGSGWG